MSAGYMQLAAIGQQDAYLTGKPEVTYFSGVYKRHTPFVLEAYDIPFKDQQVTYDAVNICRIPPKGDLIRGLTLKMQLPALSEPGNSWTWPMSSQVIYLPHFRVKPLDGYTGTYISAAQYASVSFYGSKNSPTWLVAPLSYFVKIDFVNYKFIFSNCSSIEVDSDFGVFWGFDPALGTVLNSNTVYTVSGSRPADFSFEQSGWRNVENIINNKSGLFVQPSGTTTIPANGFINLKPPIEDIYGWINYYPKEIAFKISSPAGTVQFGGSGAYVVRCVFRPSSGSVASVSYGKSSTSDAASSKDYTYTCRVSPDPSMPITFPIKVVDQSYYYSFFVTLTDQTATIGPDSWLSINSLDESYKFNTTPSLTGSISRLNFSGNIVNPENTTMNLAADSSFSFSGSTGMFLATGSISLVSPASGQYVSNVSISNVSSISNTIFVYDMSSQGRDPTFIFSMPIMATSLSDRYAFNVGLTSGSSATIDSNTFVIFHKFGVFSGSDAGYVLPDNGILYNNPTSQIVNGRTNLNNWSFNGNPYLMTNGSNVSVSNVGIYMMTATISGTAPISKVSFGTTAYDVGVGLLPPYTFTVPYNATVPFSNVDISFISTSGVSQALGSNSFISVFPIASNVIADFSYKYVDSVGTYAIKSAELKIGGQTIQTLTGEYVELWNDLYVPYENQPGLTLLTGKNDVTDIYDKRTYYTNLPFYFYGHPELSIPIVALDRQDVEVWVTFRKFSELTGVSIKKPTLEATILVEYVYLSSPEINWFKNHRLDYLITQCQYQNFDLLSNFTNSIFQLKLLNPVRELFFIIQPTNNSGYDYSGNGLQGLAMTLNGSELFTSDTTDSTFLGSLQPFIHYPTYPTRRFYMYPFTTDPSSPKPYGHINMSRIRQILLELTTAQSIFAKQFRIIAINYNVLRVENGIVGVMFNAGTQSI